jgi:hypothetical protein
MQRLNKPGPAFVRTSRLLMTFRVGDIVKGGPSVMGGGAHFQAIARVRTVFRGPFFARLR